MFVALFRPAPSKGDRTPAPVRLGEFPTEDDAIAALHGVRGDGIREVYRAPQYSRDGVGGLVWSSKLGRFG